MCEAAGFENNLWPNKTTYLRANIDAIFGTGGPFENHRPLLALAFSTGITRASIHFKWAATKSQQWSH